MGGDTEHPDTIRVTSQYLTPHILQLQQSNHLEVHQDSVYTWLKCSCLREVLPLATHCFQSYPKGTTEILTAIPRLVTSACDKLCAEEKFFGENALSKQACCATCRSTDLKSLTQVDGTNRQHGFICPNGHWGRPASNYRDFSKEKYGRAEYATRTIPPNSPKVRGEINHDDFVHLISSLPNWKSPGDDEISNEVLKAQPLWVIDHLRTLVNEILEGGVLPDDWKVGIVKLLLKKSPASNLSNQRPVCCIRTVYKLISAIINNRMTKLLERYDVLEEQQEGFRARRSCPRQTHKLVSIIEDAKENKKQLYCLWIDWGNAFNSADQEVLWEAMKLSGFDQADIALVAELYRNSTLVIDNSFGRTAELDCNCGVKQGDIISPTVFSILMNILLRNMSRSGAGYTMADGTHCNFLAFADDICLVTDDPNKMQTLVNEIEKFSNWSHMWVNLSKCRMSSYNFD